MSRHKDADAKVAAANEAERLRTDIGEDDKLYIIGANQKELDTPKTLILLT